MTIVYTSKTGYTRQYAEMLAKATGMKAYDMDQARSILSQGAPVLYLGWLMAGHIRGIDQVMRRWDVQCVAAVGMSPADQSVLTTISKANYVPNTPIFYLQGGWNPKKAGWLNRRMVNAVTRSVRRQLMSKSKRTEQEQAYLDMLTTGGSFVAYQNLKPIQDWLEKKG